MVENLQFGDTLEYCVCFGKNRFYNQFARELQQYDQLIDEQHSIKS